MSMTGKNGNYMDPSVFWTITYIVLTLTALSTILYIYEEDSNRMKSEIWSLNKLVYDQDVLILQCMDIVKAKAEVTATIYNAVPGQTDDTPLITADGTRLHPRSVNQYRFVAVSRDLLKKNGGFLEYGDYIIVENTNGRYNGIWQVKDTMNPRWKNRIDFLVDKKTPHNKFEDVMIFHIDVL